MTLFDAYMMVDWSAESKPKAGKDSVWFAVGVWSNGKLEVEPPQNPRTRSDAVVQIRSLLLDLVGQSRRVLVGFDFPYGYPAGFARALGASSEQQRWRFTWDHLAHHIEDDARNANNRFGVASAMNAKLWDGPGPFWGCPARQVTEALKATGCRYPYGVGPTIQLEMKRASEKRLPRTQPTWKLLGNGSVGGQALVGIPCVAALRDDPALSPCSRVWPFETGFTATPASGSKPAVIHAEIWPGVVPINLALHGIRDAAQVMTLARHFATEDAAGRLGGLFATPRGLSNAEIAACVAEEGWILGA